MEKWTSGLILTHTHLLETHVHGVRAVSSLPAPTCFAFELFHVTTKWALHRCIQSDGGSATAYAAMKH